MGTLNIDGMLSAKRTIFYTTDNSAGTTGNLTLRTNGDEALAPSLVFSIDGVKHSTIKMFSDGHFRFFNSSGSGYRNIYAKTFIGSLSGNASTSSIPLGFSYRETSWTWGTLTAANGYTLLTDWITPAAGGLAFADKGTKVSCQIDGYFYQDEGRYIVLDANNYTSYAPTKTGSGASGTWKINITGSAGSVAWGNVTGKPSTFTPSSHNHTSLTGITSLDFSTHSDDGATIKTTIDNKNTYLDFYLVDDGESDLFRWNFGRWDSATSSQNNVTLMTLTCAQNANTAKLVVNGTIQGSLDWSYITNKPSSFTPSSHTHSYLPLSGGTVTGTITSNAAMPFMFNGAGSSTYTCACMYVNSGGMIFETPRAGNSTSYAPLPFRVVTRGGWEGGYYAPLYCQKVIVQNYGGSLPSSGVTGEIFYKT